MTWSHEVSDKGDLAFALESPKLWTTCLLFIYFIHFLFFNYFCIYYFCEPYNQVFYFLFFTIAIQAHAFSQLHES